MIMKTLTFDNKKAIELLTAKEELILTGRKISGDIEKMEDKIAKHDEVEREITNQETPEIKAMIEEGNAIHKQCEEFGQKLEDAGNKIMDAKLALIPEDIKKEHYALRDEKEKMERERNKIALKVQKIKDKLIPLVQKLAIPLLEEFEDTETVTVEDGKVVVKVFSHLEDWKKKFNERAKKSIAKTEAAIMEAKPE